MSILNHLNEMEAKLYTSMVEDFFSTAQNAEDAKKIFKNATIAANLNAAAAFIDAAITILNFEKDVENGNDKNTGNSAATFKD